MLDPEKNRLDYGEQLAPPEGYTLDYAVGTTYSLDLEALLVIPLALFYAKTLDYKPSEINILDAIAKASEKVTVFCQKGKIKAPDKYHSLMACWERAIVEMQMPFFAASFHPKIWVSRFITKGGPSVYRLLVTSRNMTYARNWDIGFSVEGNVTGDEQNRNQPLIDFISDLFNKTDRKLPEAFLKDLSRVKFSKLDGFEPASFYPIGIPASYKNPLAKRKWEELLVISPFIDASTITELSSKTNNIHIFSRKESIDALDEATITDIGEDHFYKFSNLYSRAEFMQESEDGTDPLPQDLHAKIFIGKNGETYSWLLGSANATSPAFGRNVEFMAELKTGDKWYSPKKTKRVLIEAEDPRPALFEQYKLKERTSLPGDKDYAQVLRKLIYDICQIPLKGQIAQRANTQTVIYDLTISADTSKLEIPKGFAVRIKPLPEQAKSAVLLKPGQLNTITDFSGYSEQNLSPLLLVEVDWEKESKKFVLKMDITLPESRLDKVFSSIIDSNEKFLKYLSFVLSGVETDLLARESGRKGGGGAGAGEVPGSNMPVFENLLAAASRNPEKLKTIDAMIMRLGKEAGGQSPAITPDFLKLWEVFRGYINRH